MHLLIRSLFILPYCPLVLRVILYICNTNLAIQNNSKWTTMLQDRLTSLAVLHVHRDIDIDIDRVMRSFTSKDRAFRL
jgi:hypothetical protein